MFLVVMRVVILFAVLFAIYAGVVAYMRWDRRRELEAEYSAGAGGALTQEDFVSKGLAEFERSQKRQLLYGVFLIPVAVIAVLGFLALIS